MLRLPFPSCKSAHSRHPCLTEPSILRALKSAGVLVTTPSRHTEEGRRITCYDDRFIVQLASVEQSVIVSNDQFRDIINERAEFRETINNRILVYTFVGDR